MGMVFLILGLIYEFILAACWAKCAVFTSMTLCYMMVYLRYDDSEFHGVKLRYDD